MELQPVWWMYFLHAFTPVLVLIMAVLAAQEAKLPLGTVLDASSADSTRSLPAKAEAIASILTYILMGVVYYGIWLAAHWLVFWWLGKPMNLDAYYYKPGLLIYWFPYLFGLGFVLCRAFLSSYIVGAMAKAIMHRLAVVGFVVSLYMVFITYLKWLTN